MRWLTRLAVVVAGYYAFSRARAMGSGEPIACSGDPIQASIDKRPFEIETRKGKVTLDPRASFDVAAVVTGDEHYRFDDGAFLVPVDLVMTWGKLPEEPFRSKVSYGQITRYYFWRTKASDL